MKIKCKRIKKNVFANLDSNECWDLGKTLQGFPCKGCGKRNVNKWEYFDVFCLYTLYRKQDSLLNGGDAAVKDYHNIWQQQKSWNMLCSANIPIWEFVTNAIYTLNGWRHLRLHRHLHPQHLRLVRAARPSPSSCPWHRRWSWHCTWEARHSSGHRERWGNRHGMTWFSQRHVVRSAEGPLLLPQRDDCKQSSMNEMFQVVSLIVSLRAMLATLLQQLQRPSLSAENICICSFHRGRWWIKVMAQWPERSHLEIWKNIFCKTNYVEI